MKIEITIHAETLDAAALAIEEATRNIVKNQCREGQGENEESSYFFEVIHD